MMPTNEMCALFIKQVSCSPEGDEEKIVLFFSSNKIT